MQVKPIFTALLMLIASASWAQEAWPRTIESKNGAKIVIYQPQPESLNGNAVKGRTAFSVKEKPSGDPVFGAFWFTATMETNRDTRIAVLLSIKIDDIKLSGVDDTTKTNKLTAFLEIEIPKLNLQTTIDELLSSVEEENKTTSEGLKNDPPEIIYTTKPTTLVTMDGEPKLKDDEKFKMKKVVNTAFLIIQRPKDKKYYLYGGKFWYVSDSITTRWRHEKELPKDIKKIDKKIKEYEEKKNPGSTTANTGTKPPAIIVATKPTEVLQTNGEANFKHIDGTLLFYASNSNDNIFMDVTGTHFYVLLSGRWYTSSALKGPWTYIASDKLPEDFKKIPEGSEKDAVLASVAGTNAAREAAMDAQIPQTAKVDRKTATVTVKYDGEPKFEKIEGTNLSLAMNTSSKVFKSDSDYYCVDNGVWYKSSSATGPWKVSDERPKEVDNIPASSSAYNTKYVYVYETTPEYVYVGYTPGYMGSYVYGSTVVYGTGFYYSPWYGPYYYAQPYTFGFGMGYNPWMGWGMGFSFSVGIFSFGVYGAFYGGYWGCPMYRPPYYGHYHGGYYGGGGNNVIINGDRTINRSNGNNVYRGQGGVSTNDVKRGNRASTQPANTRDRNNVVADRQGNVHQRDSKNNWSQRNGNGWQPSNSVSTRDLNRQMQSRDRGQTRNNSYNNFNRGGNMGGGRNYGGGGARAGGGRRR